MDFRQAEAECKPGEYFKSLGGPWSEYGTQFGKTKDGKTFWTAGNTAGGDLTERFIPKYETRYGVYTKFWDDSSIRAV